MVMLKQDSLDKEQARIAAMRARAEARTQRFMNARVRTMGVDKAGLDAQVEAKRLAKEAEKKADMDQASYDQQVARVLEEQEEQARLERAAQMEALKSDLSYQCTLPKNQTPKLGDKIEAESCSIGAAQNFAGEDKTREERRRLQQAQMRQWTSQQKAEKIARAMEEKEDDMRFHQYLSAVDEMRGQLEEEEKAVARADRLNNRMLNEEQARLTAESRANEAALQAKLAELELEHAKNDPFLNEETDFAKSAIADYRVRPDHFKGYSEAQVKYIFKKNEELVSDHKETKRQEAEVEKAWGQHVAAVTRVMEENEQEAKAQADYLNQLQKEDLEKQVIVQAEKKRQMREDRFGAIDGGFYKGFGTSCR
mmetsp:Transcript_15941/g.31722  ORF Transcript_15941/g.31722 Transcript_15941/m.31722 type:complete len:367 (-) Transcript_15941:87-1187(-)